MDGSIRDIPEANLRSYYIQKSILFDFYYLYMKTQSTRGQFIEGTQLILGYDIDVPQLFQHLSSIKIEQGTSKKFNSSQEFFEKCWWNLNMYHNIFQNHDPSESTRWMMQTLNGSEITSILDNRNT